MAAKQYYSAEEAIARLATIGKSEGTFYRWVREGLIGKEVPPGRERGALYPREDVEFQITKHSRKRGQPTHVEVAAGSHGATDWITAADLPYVLALDYELYGPDDVVDLSITHGWWMKNPQMCRILYDGSNRQHIWGALTVVPLPEETIFRLLRDELKERELKPEDILTYEDGHSYFGYVASAIIRPEHRQHMLTLIRSVLNFWCEQYPRIRLSKLYAYAASDDGLNMMKHLFFSPRYDLGEDAFELDPYRRNPSRLVQEFQECISAKDS